jgi:tRNA(fMet)-specific endonuclease VapC
MRYLLDANAVIALQNRRQSLFALRIRRHEIAEIGIPAIVIHEIYFGAFRSERRENNVTLVESLEYQIVEFNREDARHAAEIRAILASRGRPIGPYDVLIAGQARARQLTLITRNTAEFARVPYLRVEDWSRR